MSPKTHRYFRCWRTPTGYAVGTFEEYGSSVSRCQTWYYKTERQAHDKRVKLFAAGLGMKEGFRPEVKGKPCPHPEETYQSSILNDDNPDLRYCPACQTVVERIAGHWINPGPLIRKVTVR